jgi:hypothetical protein
LKDSPQGVHDGVFFKTRSWRKLRRDRVFAVVEEKHRRASALNLSEGGTVKLFYRWTGSVREHFVHFTGVLRKN